jgi:hypothetical protein
VFSRGILSQIQDNHHLRRQQPECSSHILSDCSVALSCRPFVVVPCCRSWSKGMWSALGCWRAPDIGMSYSVVKSFSCIVLCGGSLLLFFYVAGCQGESAEDRRGSFVHAVGIVVGEIYASLFYFILCYRNHLLLFPCIVILGHYYILFLAMDICRDSFASSL